jgi:hypothetical protein
LALNRHGDSANVRFAPIVLQKSFLADERNFLGPLMRFAGGDVREPHRFTQERPRTFVAALWSLAAIETSKIRPSRDFWTGVKKDANEPAVIGLFGIAPVQFELVDPAKPRWRKL